MQLLGEVRNPMVRTILQYALVSKAYSEQCQLRYGAIISMLVLSLHRTLQPLWSLVLVAKANL